MPAEFLIGLLPIVVLTFLYWAIKLLVETRSRNKIIASDRSDELIRAFLAVETNRRRRASLRLGILLSCLAVGFALIEVLDWQVDTDSVSLAAIALLIGATAVGNFISYAIESRFLDGEHDGGPPGQST